MKMLLVQNDPNDLELIKLSLESYPFINQIDVAEDGEQALNYLFGREGNPLHQELPRVVVLDLKLPKVSGIGVLEAIRSHPRTKNLVVVVLTSSAEDRDLETCYNLGVNSYIIKPTNFQQFVKVMRQVDLYWMTLNEPPPLKG
jgi:CheY-like chemotaxis protein